MRNLRLEPFHDFLWLKYFITVEDFGGRKPKPSHLAPALAQNSSGMRITVLLEQPIQIQIQIFDRPHISSSTVDVDLTSAVERGRG